MTSRFYNNPFVRQVMVFIAIPVIYVLFPDPVGYIGWMINDGFIKSIFSDSLTLGFLLSSIPFAYIGGLVIERIVRFIFEVTKPYKHFMVQLIASAILTMVVKLFYLALMTV